MTSDQAVAEMSPVSAAARLIDKGCKWVSVAQNDPVYIALVRRYLIDPQMRTAVEDIAQGRDITVHAVEAPFGCVVTAKEECEWALVPSRIEGYAQAGDRIKAAIGSCIPFIASAFYPTAVQSEDPAFVPYPKTREELRLEFSKLCEALRLARTQDTDPFDKGGAHVVIERGDDAAEEAWAAILQIPEKNPDGFAKTRVRRMETLEDVVESTINYLCRWGYLREQASGEVYPTRKFQIVLNTTMMPGFYGTARAARRA